MLTCSESSKDGSPRKMVASDSVLRSEVCVTAKTIIDHLNHYIIYNSFHRHPNLFIYNSTISNSFPRQCRLSTQGLRCSSGTPCTDTSRLRSVVISRYPAPGQPAPLCRSCPWTESFVPSTTPPVPLAGIGSGGPGGAHTLCV